MASNVNWSSSFANSSFSLFVKRFTPSSPHNSSIAKLLQAFFACPSKDLYNTGPCFFLSRSVTCCHIFTSLIHSSKSALSFKLGGTSCLFDDILLLFYSFFSFLSFLSETSLYILLLLLATNVKVDLHSSKRGISSDHQYFTL